MTKLSKKKVRAAIPGSFGIRAIIAKKCDVDRGTITRYLQKERNKILVKEIEEERDKVLDVGEKKLIEAVDRGEFPAIKFLLSTKGKGRGYIEKQEIEHTGGSITTFNLIEKSVEEIKDAKSKYKPAQPGDKPQTG